MNVCKLELGKINGNIAVLICRKDIKNVHLKVYRDLTVKLSVPQNVPDDWIKNFLDKKKNWINEQLYKFKQSSGINNNAYIRNGCSIQILGKDKRIYLKIGKKNIVEEDKKITIYLQDIQNYKLATNYFISWWREKAYDVFYKEVNNYYNSIFKKYQILFPAIKIKKMQTMWGNCKPKTNTITLNEYLLKADILGVQYVVLHELTHLLYPYHNKDFYNFLTVQMPNWKERKKVLDVEVVQNI